VKPQFWFVCGAILAALGVVNGAFGAHFLPQNLPARYKTITAEQQLPQEDLDKLLTKRYADYDTAVRYHMYHAFGLMLLGIVAAQRETHLWTAAGVCFFFGVMIFSGLLYALVWTNKTILGAFVPIGGTMFIIGWLALAVGVWKHKIPIVGTTP